MTLVSVSAYYEDLKISGQQASMLISVNAFFYFVRPYAVISQQGGSGFKPANLLGSVSVEFACSPVSEYISSSFLPQSKDRQVNLRLRVCVGVNVSVHVSSL